MERYIGQKVVLEMIKGDRVVEYCGVLKDYTAEFVEILDVDYASMPGQSIWKANLAVPRSNGLIRHLAE